MSDWWCNRCQFKIFGRKDACRKCGAQRPIPVQQQAAAAAAPQVVLVARTVRVPSAEVKPGDWICPADQLNNFASRTHCFKCKRPKPANPAAPAAATGGDSIVTQASRECVVCCAQEPAVVFDPCLHMSCCKACADRVDKCPLCRAQIGKRIVPFLQ
jgi:hypothetical protein